MYKDNLETKHHYILLLKESDNARRDIERHFSSEKVNEYNKICYARNAAFAKLIELDIEFMEIDGNKTRIIIDDEFYDIRNADLKQFLGNEKYNMLIASKAHNQITMNDLREGCSNTLQQTNVYAIPSPTTLQNTRDIERRIHELGQMGGPAIERNPYAGMQPQPVPQMPVQSVMQPFINPYTGMPVNPYINPYASPYMMPQGMYDMRFGAGMNQPAPDPSTTAMAESKESEELKAALKAAEDARNESEQKSRALEEARRAAKEAEHESMLAKEEARKAALEMENAKRKAEESDAEAEKAREEVERTSKLLKETETKSQLLNESSSRSQEELTRMQEELINARKIATNAIEESENAKKLVEKTSEELKQAKAEASNANLKFESAKQEANKMNDELIAAKNAARIAKEDSQNARKEVEMANRRISEAKEAARIAKENAEKEIEKANAIAEQAKQDASDAVLQKESADKARKIAEQETLKAKKEMEDAKNALELIKNKAEIIKNEADLKVKETNAELIAARKELEQATEETKAIKEEALRNAEFAAEEARAIAKKADDDIRQAKLDAEAKLKASIDNYEKEIASIKEGYEKKATEERAQYQHELSQKERESQEAIAKLEKHLAEKEKLIKEANESIEAEKHERECLLKKAEKEKEEISLKAKEKQAEVQRQMDETVAKMRAEADEAIEKSAAEREKINQEFEEKRKTLEIQVKKERMSIQEEVERQLKDSEEQLAEKLEAAKAEYNEHIQKANSRLEEVQSLIEKERQKAEQYKNLALMDELTGVGNRSAYNEYIKNMNAEFFCFAFVDINNVKRTNDYMGHEYGDKLIRLTAEGLKKVCGKNVFRIGGDEFIVIIENERRQTVKQKMSDLRNMFANTYIDNGITSISVAIGYEFGNSEADMHTIYTNAEERMYANKEKMKEKFMKKDNAPENETSEDTEPPVENDIASLDKLNDTQTGTETECNTPEKETLSAEGNSNFTEDIDYEALLEKATAGNSEDTDSPTNADDVEAYSGSEPIQNAGNMNHSAINETADDVDYEELIESFESDEFEEEVLRLDENIAFRDISENEKFVSKANLTYSYTEITYVKEGISKFIEIYSSPIYPGSNEIIAWAACDEFSRTQLSDFSSNDKSITLTLDGIDFTLSSKYENGMFHMDVFVEEELKKLYMMKIKPHEQNAAVGSGHLDDNIDNISVSVYPIGFSNTGIGVESLFIYRDGKESKFGKSDRDGLFQIEGTPYRSVWINEKLKLVEA